MPNERPRARLRGIESDCKCFTTPDFGGVGSSSIDSPGTGIAVAGGTVAVGFG